MANQPNHIYLVMMQAARWLPYRMALKGAALQWTLHETYARNAPSRKFHGGAMDWSFFLSYPVWARAVFFLSLMVAVSVALFAPRTTTGDTKPTAAPAPAAGSQPILTPPQERLFSLLAKYQAQFAADKLIVGRDGKLHFDNAPNRGKGVDLVRDLYDSDGSANQTKFEQLVESVPPEYLRVFPENRWDSPFVVAVTDAGLRYLRH